MKVDLNDIQDAAIYLKDRVKHTQVDHSKSASRQLGQETFLKLENEQITGSFKVRGALNKIRHLTEEERSKGVIACSAGNHAQGVAYAARLSQVPATIVMPQTAPLVKVAATEGYGAKVVLYGQNFDEAFQHSLELAAETKMTYVHPFEDEKVIAGQGTIGLEVFKQVPSVDTLIVPIGGGGLISGSAIALKALNPRIRILGVQSEQAPGMHDLFHTGKKTERMGPVRTIADGIAVKRPSEKIFNSFIKSHVDEIVTVTDSEIAEAMVFLIERVKTVAEASGAAGLAAALAGKLTLGKNNVFLICGGNVDLNIISRVIEKGLQAKGRMSHISVVVADLPGSLSRLTQVFAEESVNILDVHHDRVASGVFLRETRIDFVIETVSHEHIQRVRERMKMEGVRLLVNT